MIPSYLTTIIAAVNIVLVCLLLYIYLRNMSKMKSGFTFGLALFAALFLIQNIVVFYFSVTMMPLYAEGIGQYMIAFTLLQTIAFGVLNWVSWR